MSMPTVDDVEEALTNVIDPELGLDFVELGLIYAIEIEEDEVYVTFTLTSAGSETKHWPIVVAASPFAAVWACMCFFVIPWERVSPLVSHFSSFTGFPIVAIVAASTGGAQSPARFYLFFILVYVSYFYPPR